MTKIAYITLTNGGYVDFTLNCLKSLSMLGHPRLLEVNCIDTTAMKKLQDYPMKEKLDVPDDEVETELQTFRTGNWNKVVYQKFRAIHKALLKNDFVYFTDGDIVYKSDRFIKDLQNRMDDDIDLLIQNDKQNDNDDSELCSGVMYIRSNDKTKEFFNPEYMDVNLITCDQIYVNNMKHKLNYEKLPLRRYPNGKYFREQQPSTPYLIHYNYLIGLDKQTMMKEDNNWLV
tara:strand:- start:96 stop:785 length:690 start_codon:yes stop_codon:yes gene_type:complete